MRGEIIFIVGCLLLVWVINILMYGMKRHAEKLEEVRDKENQISNEVDAYVRRHFKWMQ